ncbi:uncharacterized protein N7477_008207 [Penicillium maclennaniae]|uniref:uncharacterized protein n=1 Tax=Penicillium maclennaniae TaxID=1343394 RepID=UPI0025400843|nr:uncharacterized protein N7477_008207 [Penicillium maclennaniae]KAJ5665759.1 hypothetical protein N7477_008207 [Penicillium maclennaniae]
MSLLTNVYHLRRVADTSSKACLICYKPSTSVLITPDNKDFFYVCPAHLQDRHFCSPIINAEAEAARRKEEEMTKEIEKVKKEYEEKQKRKKERAAKDSKEKKDDKEKDKSEEKEKDGNSEEDEKDRDEKVVTGHRSENFYQMRIDRLRNIELAKRNQERMKNPALFPLGPET